MKNYTNKFKRENIYYLINVPRFRLLTVNTSTSTMLISRTNLYIPARNYPGGLPSGSTGGIGKGPKLPASNSTGTKVPPTNLTPSQTKDAVLLPNNNNSQPYKVPQHITEAEKSSSIPKPITPFQSKDPFKDTMLDQQKKQAEQMAKNKISEENVKKQMEQTHKEHLKESLLKKFKEENNIKDNSIGAVDGAGFIVTQNIYKQNTTPTVAIQPPSSVQKEEEKTNTSSMLIPTTLPSKPSLKLNEDENIVPNVVKSVLPILEVVETEHTSINPIPLTPTLTHMEDLNSDVIPESLEKKQIKLLSDLRQRSLLDDKEDALTRKGNELLQKININKQTYKVNYLDIISNKEHFFNIGLLDITNQKETLALLGCHTHMIVVYETIDAKAIPVGFLTSAKIENSFELHKTQPFSYGADNSKKQMFCSFDKPFIVNANEIKPLPLLDAKTYQIVTDINTATGVINQQEIGQSFIKQPEVNKALQDTFNNKIIPKIVDKQGELPLYDGAGLTYEKAEDLIKAHDQDVEQTIKKTLAQYKLKKNEGGITKAIGWLKNVEQAEDPYTYTKIKEAIDNYEQPYKSNK